MMKTAIRKLNIPNAELARKEFDEFEAAIAKLPVQLDLEPVHRFAKGIYARELTIPKGTFITGKIHKTRHLNILSKGVLSVWAAGEGMRRLEAPFSFVAEPGTRRAAYIHEEVVWTTIHGTDETNLDLLENDLIVAYRNPLLEEGVTKCLGR